MNKMTIVSILVLLAGSFCFVNPVNASSSATSKSSDISSEALESTPSYLKMELESPQKHNDKILNFQIGALQDSENIIEKPPAWVTNLENDYSFSLKIKIPFL